MPEFISKVQHKTYEKSEFSDEKVRSLDETIHLIKDFPYNAERTLTSVELTGPSVTIRDEDMNYLKVGLYFNGKYCVYYLDRDNHLYEYHAPDINDACDMVKDFFNGQLDLSKFEKHFFNIGNQGYFVTQYFEYHMKLWRVLMLTGLMLVSFIVFFVLSIFSFKANWGVAILPSIACLIFGIVLIRVYYSAIKNRNNYLQISRGNNIFQFGYNEDEIKSYNKNDIKEVLAFESNGSRNPNFVVAFQINFNDGSSIKLSNLLIGDYTFREKFAEGVVKYGNKSPIWQL